MTKTHKFPLQACDLLLVFGTSLVVSPFNSLVDKPGRRVPRVYVNKTKPGASSSLLGWFLNMAANVDFSRASDLVMLGDCDAQVEQVCEQGWKFMSYSHCQELCQQLQAGS